MQVTTAGTERLLREVAGLDAAIAQDRDPAHDTRPRALEGLTLCAWRRASIASHVEENGVVYFADPQGAGWYYDQREKSRPTPRGCWAAGAGRLLLQRRIFQLAAASGRQTSPAFSISDTPRKRAARPPRRMMRRNAPFFLSNAMYSRSWAPQQTGERFDIVSAIRRLSRRRAGSEAAARAHS